MRVAPTTGNQTQIIRPAALVLYSCVLIGCQFSPLNSTPDIAARCNAPGAGGFIGVRATPSTWVGAARARLFRPGDHRAVKKLLFCATAAR